LPAPIQPEATISGRWLGVLLGEQGVQVLGAGALEDGGQADRCPMLPRVGDGHGCFAGT
jgi:hypothetical protein